jgi:hypothetical protein
MHPYKETGDEISQDDAIHDGLPWSAIRIVLSVLTADQEQMGLILIVAGTGDMSHHKMQHLLAIVSGQCGPSNEGTGSGHDLTFHCHGSPLHENVFLSRVLHTIPRS